MGYQSLQYFRDVNLLTKWHFSGPPQVVDFGGQTTEFNLISQVLHFPCLVYAFVVHIDGSDTRFLWLFNTCRESLVIGLLGLDSRVVIFLHFDAAHADVVVPVKGTASLVQLTLDLNLFARHG